MNGAVQGPHLNDQRDTQVLKENESHKERRLQLYIPYTVAIAILQNNTTHTTFSETTLVWVWNAHNLAGLAQPLLGKGGN